MFYTKEERNKTPRQKKEKIKGPRQKRGRKIKDCKAERSQINHVSFTHGLPTPKNFC